MHIKTQEKIEKDIKGLPETQEIIIEKSKRRVPMSTERARQRRFLAGHQSRLSTRSIFIELDEYLITVKLKNIIYSSKFGQLKSTIERIVSQHLNEFNATHDHLTEIYNRNGFELEIKKHKNQVVTYCILDIDNFKQINDSNSHDFGDQVLQEFAIKLKSACTETSRTDNIKTIYSRYGGEEFVVAIIGEEPYPKIPEEIRKLTRGSIDGTEFRASLGFSHGIIRQSNIKLDIQRLYKEADAALYKSKREGKDRSTQFSSIRERLGKIIEVDPKHNVITIDIGKNTGVNEQDSFDVYPYKYSGMEKFIIDDGRSKKPLGTYPRIKIGNMTPFEVQDEISFCKLREGKITEIEVGDRLSLCLDEYEETFNILANEGEKPDNQT